jgi:polygalacturonase
VQAQQTGGRGMQAGLLSRYLHVNLLHDMNHKKVDAKKRIFGEDSYLRPNFIQPYSCKNILISGVTIIKSPMWNVNLFFVKM